MNVVSLLFHDVYLRDPRESGFVSAAADRYKLSLEEFDAQLAGLAQVGDRTDFLITVDDAGVSYHTVIAERLEALGRRGHCFVPTDYIGKRGFLDAAQLRALHARGHVIGSHSATHPSRFSALGYRQMYDEWRRSRHALEDLLGDEVTVASVPGGYYSRKVAAAAAEAGIRTLFNSEPTTSRHSVSGASLHGSSREPDQPSREALRRSAPASAEAAGFAPQVTVVGRYTLRHGDRPDAAKRFVLPAPWTRAGAWASWNAKGLVKPLLGPSYLRIADWIMAGRAPTVRAASRGR